MKSFGGIDVKKIAQKTGTPVFIFNEALIKSNYQKLNNALSLHYPASIFYSVKTNNELQVLKLLKGLGSKAQVSSGMEMFLCQKAGFNFDQMILDGPCKSTEDLTLAIKNNIFAYNADSEADIIMADNIARKLKKKVNIGLRINPNVFGYLAKNIEFYLSKFGVPHQEALESIPRLSKLKNINFVGLHAHIGSQILSLKPFLKSVDILFELSAKLREKGVQINYIDFGGGIPSQTLLRFSPVQAILKNFLGIGFQPNVPELEHFGRGISKKIKENIEKYQLDGVQILFEPGRAIVSNAGIVISKVISVKSKWVFIDASIAFVPENVFFTERDITAVENKGRLKGHNIAGSSLLTPDFFTKNKFLPELRQGDLVVIRDCGAYTMSRSTQFTMMRPAIYMVNNKRIRIIRRKDSYENFTGPMVD